MTTHWTLVGVMWRRKMNGCDLYAEPCEKGDKQTDGGFDWHVIRDDARGMFGSFGDAATLEEAMKLAEHVAAFVWPQQGGDDGRDD